jgi:hypothetical protein
VPGASDAFVRNATNIQRLKGEIADAKVQQERQEEHLLQAQQAEQLQQVRLQQAQRARQVQNRLASDRAPSWTNSLQPQPQVQAQAKRASCRVEEAADSRPAVAQAQLSPLSALSPSARSLASSARSEALTEGCVALGLHDRSFAALVADADGQANRRIPSDPFLPPTPPASRTQPAARAPPDSIAIVSDQRTCMPVTNTNPEHTRFWC